MCRNLEKYFAEERVLDEHEKYKQLLPLKGSLDGLLTSFLYLEDWRIYRKRFVDIIDYISIEERNQIIIVSGEFSWWVNQSKKPWWPKIEYQMKQNMEVNILPSHST